MYFCPCPFRSTSIKRSLRPSFIWTKISTSRSIWLGSRARPAFPASISTVYSPASINERPTAILPKKGSNRPANGSPATNFPSPRSAIMSVSRVSAPSACCSNGRLASHPSSTATGLASEMNRPEMNPNPLSQIVLSLPSRGIDDRSLMKSNIREHAAATIQ
jgi:hypothetical protein